MAIAVAAVAADTGCGAVGAFAPLPDQVGIALGVAVDAFGIGKGTRG